jgi:pyruvate-formate lyase
MANGVTRQDATNTDLAERIRGVEKVGDERDRRYEQRFLAQEQAAKIAIDAANKALDKADSATANRFESVNEFRQTLTDQTATFMPRPEITTFLNSLKGEMLTKADQSDRQISEIKKEQADQALIRASQNRYFLTTGLISLAVVIAGVLASHLVK